MSFKDTPIQRKLMTMILLTSGVVLLLTCAAFIAYELLTLRQATVRNSPPLGEIIAANSTAALAFETRMTPQKFWPRSRPSGISWPPAFTTRTGNCSQNILRACLPMLSPPHRNEDGYRFEHSHLVGLQPVVQGNNKRLGTLYLKSDMGAMYERLRLYGGIAALVLAVSFLVAYLLSRVLQQQISQPILALAETAKAVSDRRDYSVRATKIGHDELGLLTDAFNHMLAQIQAHSYADSTYSTGSPAPSASGRFAEHLPGRHSEPGGQPAHRLRLCVSLRLRGRDIDRQQRRFAERRTGD